MTRFRNRPQPAAPESWDNPQPISLPKPSETKTILQTEVLSLIDDLECHLLTLKSRVKAGVEIGNTLAIKTANLNFALGKYQHSLENKNSEV